MRLLLAFLLLLLVPAAATAGMKAVYRDPDGKPLVIEVGDDGSARVGGPEADQYGIWKDGVFYVVARENGAWTVARTDDLAAAFGKKLPSLFKDMFNAAGPVRTKLRIEPKGERTVGGRTGKLYAVHGLDEDRPDVATDYVASADPDLYPVGHALGGFVGATILLMAPLIGDAAAEMVGETRALFALGTPLDMAGRFRLESVERAAITPERVALPAKPRTVEQIVAGMKVTPLLPEGPPTVPQVQEAPHGNGSHDFGLRSAALAPLRPRPAPL